MCDTILIPSSGSSSGSSSAPILIKCPVCTASNPIGTEKCIVCDTILIPSSSGSSSAPILINGDKLFNIPIITLDYNESNKKFIADLNIPIIEKNFDDILPDKFAAFIYNDVFRNGKQISIAGLSDAQYLEIPEIKKSRRMKYDPTEWNNNDSLDIFIAKEFPICPTNNYIARDPELSTLCTRILQEEGQDGFIIGEGHWDYTPKKFLIDNMAELKRCGVTHLFLEHFFYNTLIQRDLREKKMTYILDKTLDHKFKGSRGGYDFRELILSAWANNITVIGIDTDSSYTIGDIGKYTIPGREKQQKAARKARITAMNYVADKIIKKEKQGKFVALIGSAHLSKIPDECLGLADILNVPSILFYPIGEKPPKINVRNFVDVGSGTIISRVDYLYYIKDKKRNNFKGGRRNTRKIKHRRSIRHRKTKLKSHSLNKRNK